MPIKTDVTSADFHQFYVIPERCREFREEMTGLSIEELRSVASILFQANQELSWSLEQRTIECVELNAEVDRFRRLYEREAARQ